MVTLDENVQREMKAVLEDAWRAVKAFEASLEAARTAKVRLKECQAALKEAELALYGAEDELRSAKYALKEAVEGAGPALLLTVDPDLGEYWTDAVEDHLPTP